MEGYDADCCKVRLLFKTRIAPEQALTSLACRNVPGVAAYFYLLSEIRYGLARTGFFASSRGAPLPTSAPTPSSPSPNSPPIVGDSPSPNKASALPRLSSQGNLAAGAIARTAVGFVLNPFTVIKSRYEVSNSYLPDLFLTTKSDPHILLC